MAISYDSNGNPKVDFAWGNFPMQPDAGRGPATPDVSKPAFGYADAAQYGFPGHAAISASIYDEQEQALVVSGKAFELLNGTTVVKTGTVKKLYAAGSLVVVIANEPVDPTVQLISPSFINILTAVNSGGGEGDKGWSKTTKVKSEKLDLALDGHIITKKQWNGYPGYVPNVESLELWSSVINPYVYAGMTWVGSTLEFENADNIMVHPNEGRRGYLLRIRAVATDPAIMSLVDFVKSDELLGKSVDAFTAHLNYMGQTSTQEFPAGHIVAANIPTDYYGNPIEADYYGNVTVLLSVYTGELVPAPTGMGAGSTNNITETFNLVIGAGENKAVQYAGLVGTDFTSFYGNGGSGSLILTLNTLPTDKTAALADVNFSGALIGVDVPMNSDGWMQGMDSNAYRYLYEIASSSAQTDMYGNPQYVFNTGQYLDGAGTPYVAPYDGNYRVIIVK